MNLLIKNGLIVDSNKKYNADILIKNGVIDQIGNDLSYPNIKIVDAKGHMVMPGGVDIHTHMELDLGNFVSVDDFYSGTVAAAYGGTTTIVDHIAFGDKGEPLINMINHYFDLAKDKSVIDYSFHSAIQDVSPLHLEELKKLKELGISSTKIYTTYGGMIDDNEILEVLIEAKKTNTLVCVHCENDGAIDNLRNKALENNDLYPIYHAKTRPPATEAEAINRLAYLSELANDPMLLIVHVSSEEGINEVIEARKRGLENIYIETCPQYLILDESKYTDGGPEEGVKYIMAPPLRTTRHKDALWSAIKSKHVDIIATDHCPFLYETEKLPYSEDFINAPGGGPGVEERVEVVLTEGHKRGVPIERLVELLSTRPAQLAGIYPRKGTISIGSDGDLIIVEEKPYTISIDNRHSACDYTSYEGFKSKYSVTTVISRGEIIIEDNILKGKVGRGMFLYRDDSC